MSEFIVMQNRLVQCESDLTAARAEIERLKADLQKAHEGWQAEVAVIRSIADDNLARADKAEAERDEAQTDLGKVILALPTGTGERAARRTGQGCGDE